MVLIGVVAFLGLMWLVAIPLAAGPDEPSHVARGAALVRGEIEGQEVVLDDVSGETVVAFELPAEIGFPEPSCFVFDPQMPASCATSQPVPDGDALLFTQATDDPVWGNLLPGIGTLVPGAAPGWMARLFDAAIPLVLLGAALVIGARRGVLAVGATMLAATPAAWFSIAVVNPSGYVIAGGIGLWVALVGIGSSSDLTGARDAAGPVERPLAWLAAASWLAMVLPVREGLLYAAVILALTLLIFRIDLRRLGQRPLVVAAVATAMTLGWAAQSASSGSLALFATPLIPAAAILVTRVLDRGRFRSPLGRAGALFVASAVGLIGVVFVMSRRADGLQGSAFRFTVERTGENLRETIGGVGGLGSPVPEIAVFVWLCGIGALVGVALFANVRRVLLGATATGLAALVISWTLTMLENDPFFWRGRFYLPLLVGVPILLGSVRLDATTRRRIGIACGIVAVVVSNLAIAQTMRRFGVGASGSLLPTDWNTYDSPLPPVVILIAHALGSIGLLLGLTRLAVDPMPTRVRPGVNVVGYHHVASGLGEIAREIHRSLGDAGVPCTAVDVEATDSPRLRDPEPVPAVLYDKTIAVVAALQLPSAMHDLPAVSAAHDRLIGYWFWELDTVPDTHRLAIETVDEIWAPTEFVRSAYAGAIGEGDKAVHLVPTTIPEPIVDPDDVASWRNELTAGPDDTLFVVSFDLFSVIERKNPFGAIDAFKQAFADGRRDVRLVIKTMNGDQRPDDLQWIRDDVAGDTRITIIDRYVSDRELDALVAAADVYVSLHRSEGLGLHLAAAMWLRTPVIATGWSGNLDLMDHDTAALVDVRLIPVSNGRGAYPDGARWADPDLDQAAEWMRRLASDTELRERFASAAHERMQAQPAPAEIGTAMWAAIDGAGAVR